MEQQRIEYNVFEKKSHKDNKDNKTVIDPDPILLKSRKSSIKVAKQIKKTLEELHKDLIGNIILIYFFQSKNKNEFIDKINNYSLETNNSELNLEQINTFNNLYKILKTNCKGICRTSKTKKMRMKQMRKIEGKKLSRKQSKINKLDKLHKFNKLNGGELIEGIKGGPYLTRLTEKGDKPITGNDLKKSITEIKEILDLVRHVDEGKWVKQPQIAISYFDGDQKKIEKYLQMELLPKYINLNSFPPSINFSGIMNKFSNVSSWISIYNKDKEFRKKYIKEQGLDPEKYIKASKYDKLVSQVSRMDSKFKEVQAKKAQLTLSGYR
jgi:hypothetical protein